MKVSGWMEIQNVGLCLILEGMKQQRRQSFQFHRYNILGDESNLVVNEGFLQSIIVNLNTCFPKIQLVDVQSVLKEAVSAVMVGVEE